MASFICNHDFQLEGVDHIGGHVPLYIPEGAIAGLLRCGHVSPATAAEVEASNISRAAEEKAVSEAAEREEKRLAPIREAEAKAEAERKAELREQQIKDAKANRAAKAAEEKPKK